MSRVHFKSKKREIKKLKLSSRFRGFYWFRTALQVLVSSVIYSSSSNYFNLCRPFPLSSSHSLLCMRHDSSTPISSFKSHHFRQLYTTACHGDREHASRIGERNTERSNQSRPYRIPMTHSLLQSACLLFKHHPGLVLSSRKERPLSIVSLSYLLLY